MNVAIRLLGLVTFGRLTSLELSMTCDESPTTNLLLERTQSLITAIHNAPSLERLAARHLIVKITDLEICMQAQQS